MSALNTTYTRQISTGRVLRRSRARNYFAKLVGGIAASLAGTVSSAQPDRTLYEWQEIHIREAGGLRPIIRDGWPDKEQKEQAVMLMRAACSAFGYDCAPDAASRVEMAGRLPSAVIESVTGFVHFIYITPPKGYETCRVRIDWNNVSMSSDSTFSAAIHADGRFALNAVVPRNKPAGQSVEARMYLQYVPRGTRAQNGCWPTKTGLWVCRNADKNCKFYPGARLADQANYR